MHKVSELVGKSIVSAESGERIGKVADMLLDQQSQRVLAIVIEGGLFSSEHVLPLSDVQTLERTQSSRGRERVSSERRIGISERSKSCAPAA